MSSTLIVSVMSANNEIGVSTASPRDRSRAATKWGRSYTPTRPRLLPGYRSTSTSGTLIC